MPKYVTQVAIIRYDYFKLNPYYCCEIFYRDTNLLCEFHCSFLVNSTTATLPVLTVFDTTSFTCNLGLASTGGPIAPFYECLPYNSTDGQWSSINYTCNGMSIKYCTRYTLLVAQLKQTSFMNRTIHFCLSLISNQWILLVHSSADSNLRRFADTDHYDREHNIL